MRMISPATQSAIWLPEDVGWRNNLGKLIGYTGSRIRRQRCCWTGCRVSACSLVWWVVILNWGAYRWQRNWHQRWKRKSFCRSGENWWSRKTPHWAWGGKRGGSRRMISSQSLNNKSQPLEKVRTWSAKNVIMMCQAEFQPILAKKSR